MTFLRPLMIIALLLVFISMLLTIGAWTWGHLFPGAMIAIQSYALNAYHLSVYDVPRRITIELGTTYSSVSMAWSRDGRLAYAGYTQTGSDIYLWDGTTITDITNTPTVDEFKPVWSADGRLAYGDNSYGMGNNLYIWDGAVIDQTPIGGDPTQALLTWSDDGRLAYVNLVGTDSEIYIWDNGVITDISQNPTSFDTVPRWSHDGRLMYLGYGGEETFNVWDGTSTYQIAHFTNVTGTFTPTWSFDNWLAFTVSPQAYVWDGTSVRQLLPDGMSQEISFSWGHDGRLVMTASSGAGRNDLYIWDRTTFTRLTDTPNDAENFPAWSDDGQLAYISASTSLNDVYLWQGDYTINITNSPDANDYAFSWWTP